MNRYQRLTETNKRYLDVMSPSDKVEIWKMVDALVEGVKRRSHAAAPSDGLPVADIQMSDNSAMNILWAIGQQLASVRNAEVANLLTTAHRSGVSLHEEGTGIRHE